MLFSKHAHSSVEGALVEVVRAVQIALGAEGLSQVAEGLQGLGMVASVQPQPASACS